MKLSDRELQILSGLPMNRRHRRRDLRAVQSVRFSKMPVLNAKVQGQT
jgi:hypothetical protein